MGPLPHHDLLDLVSQPDRPRVFPNADHLPAKPSELNVGLSVPCLVQVELLCPPRMRWPVGNVACSGHLMPKASVDEDCYSFTWETRCPEGSTHSRDRDKPHGSGILCGGAPCGPPTPAAVFLLDTLAMRLETSGDEGTISVTSKPTL